MCLNDNKLSVMVGVLLLLVFLGFMGLLLFIMKKFYDKTDTKLEIKKEEVETQLPEKKKEYIKKELKRYNDVSAPVPLLICVISMFVVILLIDVFKKDKNKS